MDQRVKPLDGYLYTVCGKLLCFTSDVLDLTDSGVVADLVGFASDLYTERSSVRRTYGKESVCVLRSRPGSDEVMIGVYPFDVLPEGSRALARKAVGLDGCVYG